MIHDVFTSAYLSVPKSVNIIKSILYVLMELSWCYYSVPVSLGLFTIGMVYFLRRRVRIDLAFCEENRLIMPS